jgi:hypothetical protein
VIPTSFLGLPRFGGETPDLQIEADIFSCHVLVQPNMPPFSGAPKIAGQVRNASQLRLIL